MRHVVFISRFPPPLGGVTVFAERKIAKLVHDGTKVRVIDLGTRKWPLDVFFIALAQPKANFLVNTLHPMVLFTLWLFRTLPRSTLYDHNTSSFFRDNGWKRRLYLFFAHRGKQIVVVHAHLLDFYKHSGLLDKTTVESPFIEPDLARGPLIRSEYPDHVLRFLRRDGGIRILTSAWRYVSGQSGGDLYGIGSSIGLLDGLLAHGVNARLLIAFGEYNKSEMPITLSERIEAAMKSGRTVLLLGQQELWPIFTDIDIFLRLTETDGESVSILEALHFGCRVLASDTVPRPAGVVTYQYLNEGALVKAALETVTGLVRLKAGAMER